MLQNTGVDYLDTDFQDFVDNETQNEIDTR
jgi:hypothetical protein